METIKGRCKTNLDGYTMTVTEFYRVPMTGERVTCLYNGRETTLKVCDITHDFKFGKPFIIVELHKYYGK